MTDAGRREDPGARGREGHPDGGLRVKVVGGGCSGLTYKMDLDQPRDGDKVFEHDGAQDRRRPQELPLPERHRARLPGRAHGVGLQPAATRTSSATCGCGVVVRGLTTSDAHRAAMTTNYSAASAVLALRRAVPPIALVCPGCGASQPLRRGLDYFAVLGLPRRLAVDRRGPRAPLPRRCRARCIPDRFQTGRRPRARAASLARERAREPRLPDAARPGRARPLLARAARRRRSASDNKRVPPALAALRVRDAGEARGAARRRRQPAARAARSTAARGDLDDGSASARRRAARRATRRATPRRAATAPTRSTELKRRLSEIAYLSTLAGRRRGGARTRATRMTDASSASISARRTASSPSWTTTARGCSPIRRPGARLLPSAVAFLPGDEVRRRREARARARRRAAVRHDPVGEALHGPRPRARHATRTAGATASSRRQRGRRALRGRRARA